MVINKALSDLETKKNEGFSVPFRLNGEDLSLGSSCTKKKTDDVKSNSYYSKEELDQVLTAVKNESNASKLFGAEDKYIISISANGGKRHECTFAKIKCNHHESLPTPKLEVKREKDTRTGRGGTCKAHISFSWKEYLDPPRWVV